MIATFNDGTEQFINQCVAYKSTCSCGYRFLPDEDRCPNCGEPRKRCQKRAMAGEDKCRSHLKIRPISLMNKLASVLTDQPLEEILQDEKLRDLNEPFLVAKLALGNLLADKEDFTDEDLRQVIACVKEFFIIAEKKKNIESGKLLNIAWDDKVINALREKMRLYFVSLKEILDKYIQDDSIKRKILTDLYNKTKLIGNNLSVPENPKDYK